jgi:hypothetical protein
MTLQSTFERALMEGELDPFDFMLAERLGKTLAEIIPDSSLLSN